MNCLTDHCVFKKTVEYLRGLGHNVVTVQELGLAQARDEEVAQEARSLKRVLITNDKDFCNILHFPPGHSCGIIVLKIDRATLEPTHMVLKRTLIELSFNVLDKSLVIVDHNGYRIRKQG